MTTPSQSSVNPEEELNRVLIKVQEEITFFKNILQPTVSTSQIIERLQNILDSSSSRLNLNGNVPHTQSLPVVENTQNVDINGESPQEIALRIPIVVENIIKRLDFDQIKSCRLLTRVWNRVCSVQLEKLSQVKIFFDEDPLIFQLVTHRSGNPSLRFSDLINLIQNSKTIFPSSHFTFKGWDMGENMKIFFDLHGPHLKHLTLLSSFLMDHSMDSDLRLLFLDHLPNLETLEMDYVWSNWTAENRLLLPSLKSLTCRAKFYGKSSALNLLDFAPSLKSVYNMKLLYLDQFLTKHSPHCIKSVDLVLDVIDIVEAGPNLREKRLEIQNALFLLTSLNLGLKGLKLYYNFNKNHRIQEIIPSEEEQKEISKSLTLLLQSSRSTLTSLEILPLAHLSPHFRYPLKFDKLTHLKLVDVPDYEFGREVELPSGDEQFFPTGIDLTFLFPSLTSVQIQLLTRAYVDDIWEFYLPQPPIHETACWPTVKNLEVTGGCSPDLLQYLNSMMPFIKKLKVSPWRDVDENLIEIWTLFDDNLEHLEICIGKTEVQDSIDLDSAITGIKREGWRKTEYSKVKGQWPGLEVVKELPGISNMTKLKKFKILVDNKAFDTNDMANLRVPTQLSVIYGFNHVPGLEVTFGYNKSCVRTSLYMETALRSIAPHVMVSHVEIDVKYMRLLE